MRERRVFAPGGFMSIRTLVEKVSLISPESRSRALKGELVRSAKDEKKKPPKARGGNDTSRPGRNVGDALRRAYDEAVREAVPSDLLDLLKKLD